MSKITSPGAVAIQGLAGSNHATAAEYCFDQPSIKPYMNFAEVFASVKQGESEYGVVAFENSTIGSINKVYDLLNDSGLRIVAEVYLRIEHCLLGLESAQLNDIEQIYSMLPALEQCEASLSKLSSGRSIDIHERGDTAESARFVAEQQDIHLAALAPRASAGVYGLKILKANMEDEYHNYTRFIVLSTSPTDSKRNDKTSIILRTSHQPGALYRALGSFAQRDINLSKLVSRPIAGNLSKYRFYIDFEAGLDTPAASAAIEELEGQGCELTILGTYTKGEVIFQ